jgi:hypothetical protein
LSIKHSISNGRRIPAHEGPGLAQHLVADPVGHPPAGGRGDGRGVLALQLAADIGRGKSAKQAES